VLNQAVLDVIYLQIQFSYEPMITSSALFFSL